MLVIILWCYYILRVWCPNKIIFRQHDENADIKFQYFFNLSPLRFISALSILPAPRPTEVLDEPVALLQRKEFPRWLPKNANLFVNLQKLIRFQ